MAKAMVDTAQRLRFPLMAGSWLPVTWRLPSIDLPMGAKIEEALMVGGAGDAMEFHALEGLQCMVERRSGGETGVKAVQLLEGDAVWKAGEEGRYSKALLTSALSRSDTPHNSAVLARDEVQIRLAENGGDPTQDGCAFHAKNLDTLFAEFKKNGLQKELSDFSTEERGGSTWKVFYVVAPDGLCYWFGELQSA